jgi:hypothetical protein
MVGVSSPLISSEMRPLDAYRSHDEYLLGDYHPLEQRSQYQTILLTLPSIHQPVITHDHPQIVMDNQSIAPQPTYAIESRELLVWRGGRAIGCVLM